MIAPGRESARMRPLVAVEIHDAAPVTWSHCCRLLDMVARAGVERVTLLVVPFHHRTVSIDRAPQFVAAIAARIALGDEAALHGFVHVDEAPPPRTLRGFVERRLLTRAEGEFAAIDRDDARERLQRATAVWQRVGWTLGGFVPPAWLLGEEARAAIAESMRFRYVALRHSLVTLPHSRAVATDTLWCSPTSAPRRAMSRALVAHAAARAAPHRLLRIALHPQDAAHSSVLDHWRRVIEHALRTRTAVTLGGALDLLGAADSGSERVVPLNRAARASARAHRNRRASGR